MTFESNVMSYASAELRNRRHTAQANASKAQQLAYTRDPELAIIERKLKRTMTDLFGASLGRPGSLSVTEIRAQNLALQQERTQRLSALGLTAEALDIVPICSLCLDEGWVEGKMCSCLEAFCTAEQSRLLSCSLPTQPQTFENFDLEFYSNRPWPDGESPRDRANLNLTFCKSYADGFNTFPFHNLFLSGAPGLGKSHLSAAIARAVSARGFSVVYQSASPLFSSFENKKFRNFSSPDQSAHVEAGQNVERFFACDLLVLDDLGCELTTTYTNSALYELVNERLVRGQHTVISSNLAPKELPSRYSVQLHSRVLGEYECLHFFGDDIRSIKKNLSV
ncbi:MAG: ATP-binding protein [Eubacteriales bacterium]